jgi:hypothetical protein
MNVQWQAEMRKKGGEEMKHNERMAMRRADGFGGTNTHNYMEGIDWDNDQRATDHSSRKGYIID